MILFKIFNCSIRAHFLWIWTEAFRDPEKGPKHEGQEGGNAVRAEPRCDGRQKAQRGQSGGLAGKGSVVCQAGYPTNESVKAELIGQGLGFHGI